MLLVAAEIVAYLIVAAALGFVAAWALRGALQRHQAASSADAATATSADVAAREAELAHLLAQRNQEIAALQQRLAAADQATHTASAPLLRTESYGDIPRFLEQLGVGVPRAGTRANLDPQDGASGNLFEDETSTAHNVANATLQRDDLKRVRGIGPKFERRLNQLGVFTYKQIALWNEEDIVRFARELHTFPDRLHHSEWVRGAREQHLIKYGERL